MNEWVFKSFAELQSKPPFDPVRMSLPSLRSRSTGSIPETPNRRRNRSHSEGMASNPNIRPFLPSPEWRSQFTNHGFEFTQGCPLRAGRWCEEETRYALRLIYELFTGEKRTPYRQSIKDVLCQELHTTPIRVFKKFKGHKILKHQTLMSGESSLLNAESRWKTMEFPKIQQLRLQAETTPCHGLRQKFLRQIALETYRTLQRFI